MTDDWTLALAEPGDRPQRITQLCVEHLDVDGAGISLVSAGGNRGVVCATDDVAVRLEDLQFSLGEGPCIDAVHQGEPVLVPDLADGGADALRWPVFLPAAFEAGAAAIFAFPLAIGAIQVGAMDLYRRTAGALTERDVSAALLAADAAALALLSPDGPRTVGFHDVVHRATGMVQAQLETSTEEAFLRLRARAFAEGRPLEALCHDVTSRRLRLDEEES